MRSLTGEKGTRKENVCSLCYIMKWYELLGLSDESDTRRRMEFQNRFTNEEDEWF